MSAMSVDNSLQTCQFSSAQENIQKQFTFFAVLLCRPETSRQRLLELA